MMAGREEEGRGRVGKGGEEGSTAGKINSREAFKCAADAGICLSAFHLMLLVPLLVHSSFHCPCAIRLGFHSVSNACERGWSRSVHEPRAPPSSRRTYTQTTVLALSQLWQSDLPGGSGWKKTSRVVWGERNDEFQLFRRRKSKIAFECQISACVRRCRTDGKHT